MEPEPTLFTRKKIALVAHDHKKPDLIAWAHDLIALDDQHLPALQARLRKLSEAHD